MKVTIVVPNWNGAELLAECLESLHKQTIKAEVIVVDNGSSDNSIDILEKKFPKVLLIKNKNNLGFAGGVNAGIKLALDNKSDAIALFNNDAAAKTDWLEKLTKVLSADGRAGIITCKLMRDDKKHFDSTGDFYSIWGMPFPRGRNQEDKGQFEKTEEVFGASGGASLYRAEMLREIGLFDERFFAYYEDVDISFRARLAGWKIYYEPTSVAYHRVSATSSKMVGSFTRYHSIKNLLLLYTKNMPGWLYLKYLPLFTLQMLRLALGSALKNGLWAYLRGIGAFIRFLPSAIKDRRDIQNNSKLSKREVDELLLHARPPRVPSTSE